jgi:DNA/RNA-binding domain of Phe-tRNA-synthetase-like protein
VNVGGRITVADDAGPFGNPTSDSARTMVTTRTTELLVVIYVPDRNSARPTRTCCERTAERMKLILGGSQTSRACR